MGAHLVSIAVPTVVVVVALKNYSFFSWHPICMATAYGFLMSEAIMIFSPSSSLMASSSRIKKINYHGYMLFGASLAALGGFAVIYTNKNRFDKPHFNTPHGVVGAACVVYTIAQVAAGVALRYGWLPRQLASPTQWRMVHGVSGSALFCASCLALLGGLKSKWMDEHAHAYVQGGAMVGTMLLASVGVGQIRHIVQTHWQRQAKKAGGDASSGDTKAIPAQ